MSHDPNLLQGYATSDDAGVYRLSDEQALVVTADFITPPVDDPFVFGQVAAANSLSDIYAMGARPLTCLNLVAFPSDKLPPAVLVEIIRGAVDRIHAAGAVLAGGHTIEDEEPKFGLAVTGIVHPGKFWSNGGARSGDVLLLTKPIGSGVILNGNRARKTSAADLERCLAHLVQLNRAAAETLAQFHVHGATDVTGFGLAGHALEMARAANLTFVIDTGAIPIHDGARALYEKGITTGVNLNNRTLVQPHARYAEGLTRAERELLIDPQTSGGLLVALPADEAQAALDAVIDAGYARASLIGRVQESNGDTLLEFR